jgi:hypothetical protein
MLVYWRVYVDDELPSVGLSSKDVSIAYPINAWTNYGY